MSNKITKRITISILVGLVMIFILWNLAWWAFSYIKYKDFLEAVPENSNGRHILVEDGYNFNVKTPDYLTFTGNLGISNSQKEEALIIWPLPFGGYEYGIRLQKNGTVYEIYMDENMKPLNTEDKDALAAVIKNKKEIQSLYDRAEAIWDLK